MGASIASAAFGQSGRYKGRTQVWQPDVAVLSILNQLTAPVDTTLPEPSLFPEPAYSVGRSNTLHWSSDTTMQLLESDGRGMNLLFFEIRAYSDSTGELWGFVDCDVDSAIFSELPSGISISYQLRYYAKDNEGQYGLSYWSKTEKSIQDISAPVLLGFEIQDLKSSGQKNWLNSQSITMRVRAFDPDSGQVAQIAIGAVSSTTKDSLLHDIEPPQEIVDTSIPYELQSRENELTTLSITVIDVAGQRSEIHDISFFWWELEKMVCFPNPFNPEKGELSTIETGDTYAQEARIFDMFGNLVRILRKNDASTFFQWDGKNGKGETVSNGGYLCMIDDDHRLICKIAVLR